MEPPYCIDSIVKLHLHRNLEITLFLANHKVEKVHLNEIRQIFVAQNDLDRDDELRVSVNEESTMLQIAVPIESSIYHSCQILQI